MRDRDFTQLTLSQHAEERRQQRGIGLDVLNVVYRFGRATRTRQGMSYSMDSRARRMAERALGNQEYCRFADKLDCYIVVAQDERTIITVAHRSQRLHAG